MDFKQILRILSSAAKYAHRGTQYGETAQDREQYGIAMTIFECLMVAIEEEKS